MDSQEEESFLDKAKKEVYLNKLNNNIDQDEIQTTLPNGSETAKKAIQTAKDIAIHPRKTYKINGAIYTIDEVIDRLSMLTTEHIKCVAFKLDHHKGVIQNRSGYVLSTLFNITEHTQKQARELLEYLIEKDKEKDEED